ncbi:putative bifunctional diguanylate cyclase/phosphodiesterase [Novosphingobium sp. JCM 18896]|uniref:putative bifunctional diguanylate cyclase/phosphodiesterase n=1 Tax=Novosphingobium sp. JCM 18896 TaxID=2989731 RepID=UPI0022218197|nr:GGDEF domain-containing phosphodiesterase [Novosphingobium sp. JCM 18896]MCW1429450.1 EAL domain-containing protein [Novosphingobium sp. JCM 18896]
MVRVRRFTLGFTLGSSLKAGLGAIFGSLEKRLLGAVLLIVACTCALQVISQDRAYKLRVESEELREAATNTEHAEQLVKLVAQFRLATHLYLSPASASETSSSEAGRADGEMTDVAIRIGEQINALRASGMELYGLQQDIAVLADIDQHVATIAEVRANPTSGRAERSAIDERNAQMASLAAAIEAKASADRDGAYDQLSRSSDNWQMLVVGAGTVTIAFALLILIDLLRNILPALRRMHVALRRLAQGDLDFEVGDFRLRELKALSGSLETFRRNAQAVKNLAFTDPSTGLPNRRAFIERTAQKLAGGDGESFLVMLGDIDRFKHVNDDYGHAVGDRLVKLIGERMGALLGDQAIVARTGGDEFAICVPLAGRAAATLGTDLVTAMRDPFDLDDYTVAISVSLGLVETKGVEAGGAHAEPDVNALINQADLALYAAKNGGRNRATRFTADLEEERELSRALERDLALALDEGQLRMVYQPIHSMTGGEDEVEALVRWQHPLLGEISPARFIPAAERSGLMVQLGYWIVQRALDDLSRWPHLSMSINLSPLQLQQEGFVGFLMDCCRSHAITPQRVILEVTESLSIERNTRALMTLNLLRNAGFRIALDDFGTGYSSLCMMKTFKFDRLKLDRSLITDLGKDPTSQAVFDAAVTMALRIGAEVVAEGISDEGLVDPVRSAGCTHVQGYHYSRPIEAEAVDGYYEAGPTADRKSDRKVA